MLSATVAAYVRGQAMALTTTIATHATAYGRCVKDCHSLLRSNAWPCSAARASLLRGFYAAAAHEPTRSDILAKPFGI